MKNSVSVLAALLAALSFAGRAAAQVSFEVLLDEHQFLAGESMPIAVRLNNHSGQTLHFGDETWVSYSVESRDGFIVGKHGEVPCGHNFDVESSKMATQRGDLSPYFTIMRPGAYTVTATLHLKDWGKEIASEPAKFDIVPGTKIWEQKFGVPRSGSAGSEPEMRKYTLLKAAYLKHLRLYLRVSDATDTRVIKVVNVGGVVSFSRPQTLLDKRNNLHLLYEDGARSYNYSVITPDGEVLIRQMHRYTDTGPRLKFDEMNEVVVVGGMRQVLPTDLPSIKRPEVSTNVLPPPNN